MAKSLKKDYGPFQSERQEDLRSLHRQAGHAYYCFCTKERLDHLRESQKAGLMPKYDGLCRGVTLERRGARGNGEARHPTEYPLIKTSSSTTWSKGRSHQPKDMDDQVLIKPMDSQPIIRCRRRRPPHGITHVVRGDNGYFDAKTRLPLRVF